jgi:hypothetical protein
MIGRWEADSPGKGPPETGVDIDTTKVDRHERKDTRM